MTKQTSTSPPNPPNRRETPRIDRRAMGRGTLIALALCPLMSRLMPDLGGKVAIVTGAGRGIGRSHALSLAEAGARVGVDDLGVSLAGEAAGSPAQEGVDGVVGAGGGAGADGGSGAGVAR